LISPRFLQKQLIHIFFPDNFISKQILLFNYNVMVKIPTNYPIDPFKIKKEKTKISVW